jgi:nitrogen fixation protein FixH
LFEGKSENPWDLLGFSWDLMRISWYLVEFSGFNRIFQCDLIVFWGLMRFFSGISISNKYYADTGFYHPKKNGRKGTHPTKD